MAQCAWPARRRAWPRLAGRTSPLSASCPLWLDRLLCIADQTGCGGVRPAFGLWENFAGRDGAPAAHPLLRFAGALSRLLADHHPRGAPPRRRIAPLGGG